ncbi:hypothetical protein MUN77_01595 [Leucobacter allii]|uniref:hypothetical protein n=1 Tax=Leucobacter allii TaxID=2932247 RepID=UPI001FD21033|nr:hypothetical protein [Leucobacter allii]UOR02053.1 hypothetical protein MUN77_01595 [Leucobacter allii]
MSYYTQSLLASDQGILQRTTACAASEGISDPQFWAQQRMWQLSAQPGWDAAYASAIAAGVEHPGVSDAVVSDPMILSAVQALHAAENPPAD